MHRACITTVFVIDCRDHGDLPRARIDGEFTACVRGNSRQITHQGIRDGVVGHVLIDGHCFDTDLGGCSVISLRQGVGQQAWERVVHVEGGARHIELVHIVDLDGELARDGCTMLIRCFDGQGVAGTHLGIDGCTRGQLQVIAVVDPEEGAIVGGAVVDDFIGKGVVGVDVHSA